MPEATAYAQRNPNASPNDRRHTAQKSEEIVSNVLCGVRDGLRSPQLSDFCPRGPTSPWTNSIPSGGLAPISVHSVTHFRVDSRLGCCALVFRTILCCSAVYLFVGDFIVSPQLCDAGGPRINIRRKQAPTCRTDRPSILSLHTMGKRFGVRSCAVRLAQDLTPNLFSNSIATRYFVMHEARPDTDSLVGERLRCASRYPRVIRIARSTSGPSAWTLE